MELVDALAGNTSASSPVELSLNPAFRRQYASLFDGIENFFKPAPTLSPTGSPSAVAVLDSKTPDSAVTASTGDSKTPDATPATAASAINSKTPESTPAQPTPSAAYPKTTVDQPSVSPREQRFQQEHVRMSLIGSTLPPLQKRAFHLLAADATSNPRPFSPRLKDRSFVHAPNPIRGNKPITIGHAYSAVVYLPEKEQPGDPRWVVPFSIRRIGTDTTATTVAAEQIKAILPILPTAGAATPPPPAATSPTPSDPVTAGPSTASAASAAPADSTSVGGSAAQTPPASMSPRPSDPVTADPSTASAASAAPADSTSFGQAAQTPPTTTPPPIAPAAPTASPAPEGSAAQTPPESKNRLTVTLCDSAYGNANFAGQTADEEDLVIIARIRGNRIFYCQPESGNAEKSPGHPTWYGLPFDLKDESTWPVPDLTERLTITTPAGKIYVVQIEGWDDLLMKGKRGLDMHDKPFRLVRVRWLDDQGKPVFQHPMWLAVFGSRRRELSLKEVVEAYQQRYDIEHFFRFGKQKLLLTAFQTADVEHEENWWQIVMLAYVMLWVTRQFAGQNKRPWERYQPRPKTGCAATQRDFSRITRTFGTPATAPKPRGYSNGRVKGTKLRPRPRLKVVRKNQPTKTTVG